MQLFVFSENGMYHSTLLLILLMLQVLFHELKLLCCGVFRIHNPLPCYRNLFSFWTLDLRLILLCILGLIPRYLVFLQKAIDELTYCRDQFKYCQTVLHKLSEGTLFFHRNAGALKRQFGLAAQQASSIIAVCPDCQKHSFPSVAAGVNPRGLQSLPLWQTDVTHDSEFGSLKYIHSSIDTFSGALVASCHTGEKARAVRRHLMRAFAALGIPLSWTVVGLYLYVSTTVKTSFALWGRTHITGIAHSPTGRSLIEGSHRSLKRL